MLREYGELIEISEMCGIKLGDELYKKLDLYAEILTEYNKKINLTAIMSPDEMYVKHFLDSMIVCTMLDFPANSTVIDIGSGAGFPLVPMKLYRPDLKITLLDSLKKRTEFLKILTSELGFEANIINDRAENAAKSDEFRENYDFCVARAVAPLSLLCEYCLPFVKVGGHFLALKGPSEDAFEKKKVFTELGAEVYGQNDYSLPNGDSRRIIISRKVSHISSRYPRNSNQILKHPLV